MKKRNWIFILSFLFCANAFAQTCDIKGVEKDAPALCGKNIQGGMFYGEAKGWDVYSGDEKISLKDIFVLGLSRNQSDTVQLKFCHGDSCQTYSYLIKKAKYNMSYVTVPRKYREPSKQDSIRIQEEKKQIIAARASAASDTAVNFLDIRVPSSFKKFRVSTKYGSGRVYNNEKPDSIDGHGGIDYAASMGTPIPSFSRGTVVLAANHYLNGNIVIVSLGHNVFVVYLHMSKIKVKVGDKVDFGTIIGNVGSTGQSDGPHLHFGMSVGSTYINPKWWFENVRN